MKPMRILVTGMTAKQRGSGRPKMFLLLDAVTDALRFQGHEIVREHLVQMDDDLSEFDAAIVGVYSYTSTAATAQKFACVKVCAELPHVLAWDDWHAKDTFGTMRKTPSVFWRTGVFENDMKFHERVVKPARANKDVYNNVVDLWSQEVGACIVCAFGWGDHSILRAQHQFGDLLCWDPDPWSPYPTLDFTQEYEELHRKRQWVVAGLTGYGAWAESLGLTWPIVDMSQPKPGARSWQVPETEIFAEYARSWGVLSPPYEGLFGSGYWRNRFGIAAKAGAVMCCDPREVRALDKSWYYVTPAQIESLSSRELYDLAQCQRAEMHKKWAVSKVDSAVQLTRWLDENWQMPIRARLGE